MVFLNTLGNFGIIVKNKQSGESMMDAEMKALVDKVRGGFALGSHISVTQISRSTKWRQILKEKHVLEVLDRTKTTAVLMDPDVFLALMQYMAELEGTLVKKSD